MITLNALHQSRVFKLHELDELMPLLWTLTHQHNQQIKDSPEKAQQLVQDWNQKVMRLGGQPRGVWLADFDSGTGYYCWKFPEKSVLHWHGYQEGFQRRTPCRENSHMPNQPHFGRFF